MHGCVACGASSLVPLLQHVHAIIIAYKSSLNVHRRVCCASLLRWQQPQRQRTFDRASSKVRARPGPDLVVEHSRSLLARIAWLIHAILVVVSYNRGSVILCFACASSHAKPSKDSSPQVRQRTPSHNINNAHADDLPYCVLVHNSCDDFPHLSHSYESNDLPK